jgi:hypothetical protein
MTGQEIADRALEKARRGFDEAVQELTDLADGDLQVLIAASEILSKTKDADGPAHAAFSYVAAAYKKATGIQSG